MSADTPAPASEVPAAEPTLGGISRAWIAQTARIIGRDGHALRAGVGPWIEAQSINTGLWHPLCLEGRREGDVFFARISDRDAVLAELERLARPEPEQAAPIVPCPECHGLGYTQNLRGVTRDCDCVRRAARA